MAKRPSRVSRGGTSTRPAWTRLVILAVIFVALYASMFISGHTTPKLGLDLQGGTSVTLTPKLLTANKNAKVPSSALDQAVDIIRQRVDGLGVAEADVVKAGNNIEISVPGKGRDQVVQLVGQTAQLAFRIPYSEVPAPTAAAQPSATPTPTPKPSAAPSASASAGAAAPKASTTPKPTPSASPSAAATCVSAPATGTTPPPCITAQAKLPCAINNPATADQVRDAPAQDWLVACDQTGSTQYVLRPASLKGTAVSGASATIQTGANGTSTGQWIVNVDFTNKGQNQWSDLTGKISSTSGCPASNAPNCQLAVVLDGVVQSSPVIQERISGSAQITGSFTQKSASDLANVLKFGALPLTFSQSQVSDVSATLGKASLHAGLLAGLIGLGLVVIYSFIYYRALGIVTIASLLVSGALTYACVVLLGVIINFTLSLAGIAGFIVAVGITADSFVVFYERLKDEVHEGRTVRASVERSWVRARRTILSADTVSFLAAAALYWLSIGSVRGFAFTLGLSTLLDLVVVFLFTKPVVTLLVRRPLFSTSRYSGLTPRALGTSVQPIGPAPRTRLAKRPAEGEVSGEAPPEGPPSKPADASADADQEGS